MKTEGNKFLMRTADEDIDEEEPIDGVEEECPQNFELKWMTEVSSSIYATPLITDLYSDGKKQILVNSFVHYVEALEGADGSKSGNWPTFHSSSVHASPLLTDINHDGLNDVLVAAYSGEILFFRDTGEQLPHKLVVPRLKVKKNWFAGLNPDPTDHEHPDVTDLYPDRPLQEEEPSQIEQEMPEHVPVPDEQPASGQAESEPAPVQQVPVVEETPRSEPGATSEAPADSSATPAAAAGARRRLLEGEEAQAEAKDAGAGEEAATVEADPEPLSEEALESFDSFEDYEAPRPRDSSDPGDPDQARDSVYDRYSGHYDDYRGYGSEEFWEGEEFEEEEHLKDSEYLDVDAHILCTPVVVDLDGDGGEDLVVAVSYFFDREYYDSFEHHHELGDNVDISKYVGGGIVVFDLGTRDVRWQTHLDLTTDTTAFRAYMYSSPTVADIDGDGKLEIVVGTSVGFIYALNADGTNRPGFPIQMGEVQGQVVVADVNDDGYPEIVACDIRGNVGVFNWRGKEVWERHLRSLISQGATIGDVNGDGKTEVVVGTSSGHVHVLNGRTGTPAFKAGVPDVKDATRGHVTYRTRGRVMSPVMLIRLHDHLPQLHMVTMSFDGLLYVIDGGTGCADTYDLGETSYAMVLAEDLDSNGRMDLVVSTMNGNVYCFETPVTYHPLKTWPQQVQSENGFVARHNWVGIMASPDTRRLTDVGGDVLTVMFDVVDNRPLAKTPTASDQDDPTTIRGPYSVKVSLLVWGHAVPYETTAEYMTPGTYALTLPIPRQRVRGTIVLRMTDARMFAFTDSFPISFHMHMYRMLKWLLALPFLGMALASLSMSGGTWEGRGASLPSAAIHHRQN